MWKRGQNGEKNWFGDSCTFLVAEKTHIQLQLFHGFPGCHISELTGQQLAGS